MMLCSWLRRGCHDWGGVHHWRWKRRDKGVVPLGVSEQRQLTIAIHAFPGISCTVSDAPAAVSLKYNHANEMLRGDVCTLQDVPPFCVAVGNPAKVVKRLRETT